MCKRNLLGHYAALRCLRPRSCPRCSPAALRPRPAARKNARYNAHDNARVRCTLPRAFPLLESRASSATRRAHAHACPRPRRPLYAIGRTVSSSVHAAPYAIVSCLGAGSRLACLSLDQRLTQSFERAGIMLNAAVAPCWAVAPAPALLPFTAEATPQS